MKTVACAGVSALLISTLAGPQAFAGAFHLNERSTAAIGASLSGSVSSARDVTFATFNPAALKTVEKFEAGGNISLILPIAEGEFKTGDLAGTKVDGDLLAVVPSFALGYRVNEKLVIGFTTYSPFGLSTDYKKNSPVQFDARESDLLTISLSPTISYDVMDNLTFGASLDVLYAEARLTSFGGPPPLGIGDIELDGNDWGVGFSLGMLFEPVPGTRIGAAYHHGYDLDLPTDTFLGQKGTAEASLPNWIQVGVTQSVSDDLRIMAEGRWINWSKFDSIDITTPALKGAPGPIGDLASVSDVQGYKDSLFFSVGAEYDLNEQLTLRGGVAWDETPTTDKHRTARIPDEDRLWFSVGASYSMSHSMSADVGYSYLHALRKADVTLRSGPLAGSKLKYDGGAHIFSLGWNLKF
ncbi:MAG: OmpP1/FadL family transporter [Alphaproteobacteria bacterium]